MGMEEIMGRVDRNFIANVVMGFDFLDMNFVCVVGDKLYNSLSWSEWFRWDVSCIGECIYHRYC